MFTQPPCEIRFALIISPLAVHQHTTFCLKSSQLSLVTPPFLQLFGFDSTIPGPVEEQGPSLAVFADAAAANWSHHHGALDFGGAVRTPAEKAHCIEDVLMTA